MTIETRTNLDFREAQAALRAWCGRRVRIEVGHRSSLENIAAVPEAMLLRLEAIPDDSTSLAGSGFGLMFVDTSGAPIVSLVVNEQLFQQAAEYEVELQLYLDDVAIFIQDVRLAGDDLGPWPML